MSELEKIARELEAKVNSLREEKKDLLEALSGTIEFAPKTSLRKATASEIKAHLRKEADKKGFVKGAKVNQRAAYYGSGCVFIIDDTNFIYDPESDNLSIGGYGIYNTGKWAEILPSHPHIEVNGYKAEFKEWGLDFNNGCAKISSQFILDVWKLMKTQYGASNKMVEKITIGSGEFTKEQIKEIAKYYSK